MTELDVEKVGPSLRYASAKAVKANRSGTVTEDAVLAGKGRFIEGRATVSDLGGYPMSFVPVVRWLGLCARCGRESAGEFVTPELAQAQAERCKCLTRGVPYTLTASVHRLRGAPTTPHSRRPLQHLTTR